MSLRAALITLALASAGGGWSCQRGDAAADRRPPSATDAIRQVQLRKIRIHDLRHTYASLLIAQGESLAYVKDQMGHHSIRVTVDTYGHLVPGGNKAAVDRLDDASDATIRNPDATSSDAAELGAR